MNFEVIKMLLTVGQILLSCAIGVWLYFDRRNDTTQARISVLEKTMNERLGDHDTRLATVEANQDSAVTQADLSQLNREIGAANATLAAMTLQLERIQNWLLANK